MAEPHFTHLRELGAAERTKLNIQRADDMRSYLSTQRRGLWVRALLTQPITTLKRWRRGTFPAQEMAPIIENAEHEIAMRGALRMLGKR